MRTDATYDRKQVSCPNASTLGYGKYKAQTGDLIVYREHYTNGTDDARLARVIGRVDYAPALDGDREPTRNRLVVLAMATMPSFCFERWINPEDVIEILAIDGEPGDKIRRLMEWFLSPDLPRHSMEELLQWQRSGFATMTEWKEWRDK